MTQVRYLLILILIISPFLKGDSLTINSDGFSARIERDKWGVPHIYGKRDADVSFGLAYAHAQDDFKTIQDILLASRGKLASVYGKGAAVNDYYVHLMDIWNHVDSNYTSDVPDDVKALCDGYAAGINLFLQDHPERGRKKIFPVNGKDLIAGFSHRMPLMFGLDGVMKKLSKEKRPQLIGLNGNDEDAESFKMVASNVFAIAPHRSSDGYTRIWINSHQPWDGPVAWYEAHFISEEGWDFYGGLFPGSPIPLIGHNPYLGWSHTVNSPDLIDVYDLKINPGNKDQYWFEGSWQDMKVRKVPIKVKLFGPFSWTFKRTVKESIHGPVMEFEHGTYALRISSIKNLKFLEEWYRMGKATNFDEFRKAMEIHALPMFNTGYADKDGNIFYVYNAKIPKRDDRYNWHELLAGDEQANIWTNYVPFDSLPQVLNPADGFLQNCNSNPYLATGNPTDVSKPLPDWTGIETHQTNRAMRALETFGEDSSITRKEFFKYKYDKKYSSHSTIAKVRDRFIQDIAKENTPEFQEALELIRNWNLSADSTNKAAALSMIVLPNSFNEDNLKYDIVKIKKKLRETIDFLINHFGRIDVPLGKALRLVRGETDLPLGGGPDLLRAIYFKEKEDKYVGTAGDCYFQAVEWGPNGELNAWTIHQYGSATAIESSIHYDDQAKLFSKQEMKQVRP
ncbi:MAG TPA: acylase [Candidatus Marinimicrobia bacterium]|nr:acylase [Candidatus Neomarinimicrobiota bacterium]